MAFVKSIQWKDIKFILKSRGHSFIHFIIFLRMHVTIQVWHFIFKSEKYITHFINKIKFYFIKKNKSVYFYVYVRSALFTAWFKIFALMESKACQNDAKIQ